MPHCVCIVPQSRARILYDYIDHWIGNTRDHTDNICNSFFTQYLRFACFSLDRLPECTLWFRPMDTWMTTRGNILSLVVFLLCLSTWTIPARHKQRAQTMLDAPHVSGRERLYVNIDRNYSVLLFVLEIRTVRMKTILLFEVIFYSSASSSTVMYFFVVVVFFVLILLLCCLLHREINAFIMLAFWIVLTECIYIIAPIVFRFLVGLVELLWRFAVIAWRTHATLACLVSSRGKHSWLFGVALPYRKKKYK